MGAPNERYYFGDVRLYQHGMNHDGDGQRGALQEFQGVDQMRALVIPANPNVGRDLVVQCMAPPQAAARNRKGFRGAMESMRELLEARADRSDPVTWVEDDARSKVVTGYAAPTVTSAAHGFGNGDVLLVRRLGLGLFSLVDVGAAAANTFNVAARAGTVLHAIANGDELHLVEAYWLAQTWATMSRVPPGDADWGGKPVEYQFRGSGKTTYRRTAVSVGS